MSVISISLSVGILSITMIGIYFLVFWRIERRREFDLKREQLHLERIRFEEEQNEKKKVREEKEEEREDRKWREYEQRKHEEEDSIRKSAGAGTGGFILLDLPDAQKPLFHDLLKGFEEYAQLRGYSISFSVDNTLPDKIAFKFTVVDTGVTVSTDKVKQDLQDYINKVKSGLPLDDLPTIIPEPKHQLLLMVMKNRINFLQHSYTTQKNVTELYENILKELSLKGFGIQPAPNFYIQGGGQMTPSNYNAINSNQIAQGKSIRMIDNQIDQSIRIENSFNERKDQIESISKLLDSLKIAETNQEEKKEEVIRNISNVKDELSEEEVPEPLRIKKWLEKAKNSLRYLKIGKEVLEQAKELFSSFGISM